MFTVTGKGIVCKEPELRYTPSGTAVCHAVAVNNEEYKGEKTGHFTNLVLFGERAEDFAKEVTKGCLIEVTKSILKHPVRESNGKTYYNTEVTVLDWELIQKFESKPTPPPKNNGGNRGSRSNRNK
jgi:single-strand DNA-binding protein